jgi:hypothetical protein
MPVTAYMWVEGEILTAVKLNTIRNDILELDAVGGFLSSQFGSITIGPGATSNNGTIAAVSVRAAIMLTGFVTDANSTEFPGAVPRLAKSNSTTLTGFRQSTNATTTLSYCVIESRG